jgi:hypothetical protein
VQHWHECVQLGEHRLMHAGYTNSVMFRCTVTFNDNLVSLYLHTVTMPDQTDFRVNIRYDITSDCLLPNLFGPCFLDQ